MTLTTETDAPTLAPAYGPGTLRVVRWVDPIADPHGLHPCSKYVEFFWLGVLGPSTTWLLRRLSYGLEAHPDGFDLDLADTARALGLGDRQGKNAPFQRALRRLATFEMARPHGPGGLAVRTRIPPLPLASPPPAARVAAEEPPGVAGRTAAGRGPSPEAES